MPALDRTKIAQNAEKLLKAGKLPEAITEYRKLADDNPRDMNVMNKLGDLYVRASKSQDAIRTFLRIADFYASDGFFLKAIAMYKKISKLDPSNMDCLQKLAALYLQQGLTIEAKAQFMEVAEAFVKAGQFKKSVEVLAKVLEIEPDNLKARMTYADLLVRTGSAQEAGRQFAQTARDLADKGMLDEALKVGQKGLKLTPGDAGLMSVMLSITREAKKNPDALLASVVQMAKANGENPRSLALLGEAYLTAGKTAEADKLFARLIPLGAGAPVEVAIAVGRYHVSRNEEKKAIGWIGRAVEALIDGTRAAEAAALLEDFLRAFPDSVDGLTRRAEAAAGAGDRKGRIAALERLARALQAGGETARAKEVVKTLQEIEPDNPAHAGLLADLDAGGDLPQPAATPRRGAPAARPAPAPEPAFETGSGQEIGADDGGEEPVAADGPEPDAGDDLDPGGATLEAGDEEYSGGSRIQEMQEVEEEAENDDFVSEHFTEAEVFIKYGLLEKAKQQLLSILAKYPKHIAAHGKLKEIYFEEGNKEKAVEECLALAEILNARKRAEEARDLINEAIRIDPNNPRVREVAAGASAGAAAKPTQDAAKAAPPKPAPAKPAPAKSAPAAPPELEIIEEGTDGAPALTIETEDAAPSEGPVEIEISGEDGAALEAPEQAAPVPIPAASGKHGAPGAAASDRPGPEKVEEETPEDLERMLAAGSGDEITIEIDEDGGDSFPAAAASTDPDPEKLGEVDFYIDQGLVEEARAVLVQLQKKYPQSGEVAKRLERANKPAAAPAAAEPEPGGLDLDIERAFGTQKISVPKTAAPAATAAPRGQKARPVFKVETTAPEVEGDFFDLASEIDHSLSEAQVAVEAKQDAPDGPGHSLDEIFKAFKKGVEQQVEAHDYETHYNLGIAYKEMGLVDEAIGEFQFAARDPGRAVECCGILGLCFREKGMPDLALKWFRKGLDSPDLAEHESIGLRYDIAEVLREQGDYGKALQYYTEVYGIDSTYRDVSGKIKELRQLAR